MAFGADRINILKLVVTSAFVQVSIGLTIGIPVTIFGSRVMANQLFGVTSHDLSVLAVTTMVCHSGIRRF
jgi:ABC-type antimicrobial peptide transport system permease subunit